MKLIFALVVAITAFGACQATTTTTSTSVCTTLDASTTTITIYSTDATVTYTVYPLSASATGSDNLSSSVVSVAGATGTASSGTVTSTTTMTSTISTTTYVDTTTTTKSASTPSNAITGNAIGFTGSTSLSQFAFAAPTTRTYTVLDAHNTSIASASTTPPLSQSLNTSLTTSSYSVTNPDVCVRPGGNGIVFDCGSYSTPTISSTSLPLANATSTTHSTTTATLNSHLRSTVTSTSIITAAGTGTGAAASTAGSTGTFGDGTPLNGGYAGAMASFVGAGAASARPTIHTGFGFVFGLCGLAAVVECGFSQPIVWVFAWMWVVVLPVALAAWGYA